MTKSVTPRGVEHTFSGGCAGPILAVTKSVTPRGVEHRAQSSSGMQRARAVTKSVTPRGVEHDLSRVELVIGDHVTKSVTPRGVEHVQVPGGVPAARGRRDQVCDAERR